MADAALPSIGVVTTLQNKVGTSLSGITSLLTPKEQTSAMVQAGASAMSTSVLLGIKNDTEKTLYQTTRTADILSDQFVSPSSSSNCEASKSSYFNPTKSGF